MSRRRLFLSQIFTIKVPIEFVLVIVQPFAVFAFAAIFVALCAVFLFLGKGVFSNSPEKGLGLGQPMVLTASAIILIGIFLLSLFFGREIIYGNKPTDMTGTQVGTSAQESVAKEDLDDLAARVDKAADNVHSGLQTTKELVGKTESRNEAIEQGRDHAKKRLNSLSERIQKASQENRSLHPFDRRMADHVTEGVE